MNLIWILNKKGAKNVGLLDQINPFFLKCMQVQVNIVPNRIMTLKYLCEWLSLPFWDKLELDFFKLFHKKTCHEVFFLNFSFILINCILRIIASKKGKNKKGGVLFGEKIACAQLQLQCAHFSKARNYFSWKKFNVIL